jgi:hypothetical protein
MEQRLVLAELLNIMQVAVVVAAIPEVITEDPEALVVVAKDQIAVLEQ